MTGVTARRRIDLNVRTVPILVTARNERNLELLSQLLRDAGYAPVTAPSVGEIDRILDGDDEPALAVLDVEGFDEKLWNRCETLRATGTPFLILSLHGSAFETDGLRHGAWVVLEKPVGKRKLLETLELMLQNK